MLLSAYWHTDKGGTITVKPVGYGMLRISFSSDNDASLTVTIAEAESLRDAIGYALQEIETAEIAEREWKEEEATNQMG